MAYLMDDLAAGAHLTTALGKANHPVTRIYPDLYQRMRVAPRFLLDEETIAAAVELSLGRPKILLEALKHLRIPYPVMWIEWPERGRDRLRKLFEDKPDPNRPLPARLGFLIESIEGGRAGQATWVWSGETGFLNIGAVSPAFDLDGRFFQDDERMHGFLKGNLANYWKANPSQLNALFDIWRTGSHRLTQWGEAYVENMVTAHGVSAQTIRAYSFADVYGEYIIIWAVMLLLTASRKAVEYHPVDRSKLNKARTLKREPLLLDHTEVVLHINGGSSSVPAHGVPLGHARKSPHVHLVSRYLARRGDKHWVVEPYLRGSGELIPRYVKVRK